MAVQRNPDACSLQGCSTTWRRGLPTLHGAKVTLRQLRIEDAPALLEHVAKPRVLRYIAPSPVTVHGFRRFVTWTRKEQRRGAHVCFALVPAG